MEIDMLANSEEEKMKFWKSLIPEIKEGLQKYSITDRFLEVHECEAEEIISYSRNPIIPAIIIGEEEKVEIITKGDRVYPFTFWIQSIVTVPLSQIAMRQYDLVRRCIDKVTFTLCLKEDTLFTNLVEESIKLHKHCMKFNIFDKILGLFIKGRFLDILGKSISKISNAKYLVLSTILALKLETILYKHGSESALKDFKEGKLFGLDIIKISEIEIEDSFVEGNKTIFSKALYIFPEEKIGHKAVRCPLTSVLADQFVFGKAQYGALFEILESMTITKTDSIYKIII